MLLWQFSSEPDTFSVQYQHLSWYEYSFWANIFPTGQQHLAQSLLYSRYFPYTHTMLLYRPLKISPILIETALGYEEFSEDAQPIIYSW